MLAGLLFLLCDSYIGPPPSLQPYRRTSPDGRWELSVDPSDRRGVGPARYRCTHDGNAAWSGEKPWTFWDAIVTNEGFSAGYAYAEEFHAVILAPDGMVRLDDARTRESSRFMHMPANPLGNGLFEQPDLRRIVFRIADPDVNRKKEEWWCFRLPDGKEEFRKHPRDAFDRVGRTDSVIAARGLAGTRWTLVEWRIFDWPRMGLRFTLVDADLAPVWDLAGFDEMSIGANQAEMDRMHSFIYRRGTIFEEAPAGGFAIGLPKSGTKIHFVIEGDASHPAVREIGREPWSLPDERRSALRLADLPFAPLETRGEFQILVDPSLKPGEQPAGSVRSKNLSMAVDVLGRVVVQDEATRAIHVFDGKGKPLFVCTPTPGDFEKLNPIAKLVATRDGGVLAQSGMISTYVRFGPDGIRTEKLEPKLHGGRLVASPISDDLFGGIYAGSILRLGPDLIERGRFDRAPDGTWLDGAAEITTGPDGALAVCQDKGTYGNAEFELILFENADPKKGRALPIPNETSISMLELGPSWAAVGTYGDEVLLVRRRDGRLVRFRADGDGKEKRSWRFGFDPDREELVAVEAGSLRIHRYALP